jgi:hypothetical protein
MDDDLSFEQIRADFEARQRSILWPDYLRALRSVYGFLWKGDREAKPVQRAGLVVFALQFLALGISVTAPRFGNHNGGANPGFLIGLVYLLISLRLLRNAFLQSEEQHKSEETDSEMDEPQGPNLQITGIEGKPQPVFVSTAGAPRPLRIVIPGGSGQVGQMLASYFQERGHHVTVLTRGPYAASWQTVHWDGRHPGLWTETLEGADVCINLTGRSINCRHTLANRREIYQSRIGSTLLLHRVIASLDDPPRLWLNASAATLYPRLQDESGVDLPLDERVAAAAPATGTGDEAWAERRGFMKRVVRDWEAAFFSSETPRTRKIALRSGVVFSPTPGSVFAILLTLVRLSLGGRQGNGRQFVAWIHQADYARAIEFLIRREDLDGPFNLTAPYPVPNREFMAALREAAGIPNGLPAPSLFIHIGALLMGTAPELVLDSCRAVPGRLLGAGFEFQFPQWPEAAEDLAHLWRHRHD